MHWRWGHAFFPSSPYYESTRVTGSVPIHRARGRPYHTTMLYLLYASGRARVVQYTAPLLRVPGI